MQKKSFRGNKRCNALALTILLSSMIQLRGRRASRFRSTEVEEEVEVFIRTRRNQPLEAAEAGERVREESSGGGGGGRLNLCPLWC